MLTQTLSTVITQALEINNLFFLELKKELKKHRNICKYAKISKNKLSFSDPLCSRYNLCNISKIDYSSDYISMSIYDDETLLSSIGPSDAIIIPARIFQLDLSGQYIYIEVEWFNMSQDELLIQIKQTVSGYISRMLDDIVAVENREIERQSLEEERNYELFLELKEKFEGR